MKTVNINTIITAKTGQPTIKLLTQFKDAYIVYKLEDILQKRGLSQRQLSELTGIRQATISNLATGKSQLINKDILFALMFALRITDISDIIDIKLPPAVARQFHEEADSWEESKTPPASLTIK